MTLILGSTLILASHHYISEQTEDNFILHYSAYSSSLAGTLSSLDIETEKLMLNAAKVVAAKENEKGLLSDQALKDLRDELNVSHLFIINKTGKFIRSTNEDADKIPNLFSFCGDYKKLVKGSSLVEATPVIKPDPEPSPHKFLSIPTNNKQRIIEVGIRVDFIAKTLTQAVVNDKNLQTLSLFDPQGTSLGRFSNNHVEFADGKITLPSDLKSVAQDEDSFKFYSKVDASHKICCQCDVSGTSKNGEYYYVLETRVSKDELKAIQATTNRNFLILGFVAVIFSLLVSRIVSRKLVRNIERAAAKVKRISTTGTTGDRINSKAQDEVAYLTEEFDKLLDKFEHSQQKIIENEKVEAKVQLAKEIAHNIKSPITAIEMMIPMMYTMPDHIKGVLNNSVNEIKSLSQKLKSQADSMSFESDEPETMFLPIVLKDILAQKQIEYSANQNIQIELIDEVGCSDAFVKGISVELKAILSNLINNAVESYGEHGGKVIVRISCDAVSCTITVEDTGVGIPAEYLSAIGKKPITFKGNRSRGLGLTHAYKVIQSWGGDISIKSNVGFGTKIKIYLYKSGYFLSHLKSDNSEVCLGVSNDI